MPTSHSVDQQAGIVHLTLRGVLTLAEMVATVQAVLDDLEPGRRYDVLSDHRELEEPATREQMLQLTEFLRSRGTPFHGRRWAVIVGGPASYGVIRMLSVHLEAAPIHTMPFYDAAEARAWLAEPRTPPVA
jgi:hypothetical protein